MCTYKYVCIYIYTVYSSIHIYIFTYIYATYVIAGKHQQIQEYTCIYTLYTRFCIYIIYVYSLRVYITSEMLFCWMSNHVPPVRVFEKRWAALLPPVLQHGLQH